MRLRGIFAAISLSLAAGCSDNDVVRVALVRHDWFNAPLLLAVDGWEGKAAPNVKTYSLTSGLASKTAVISGNADVGLASPLVLVRDPEAEHKILVLGCYMSSDKVLGIVTKTEGAVAPPIGYVAGTVSEVFLAEYMIHHGHADDYFSGGVEKIALSPPNLVEALTGSVVGGTAVNSVVVWEPHLSRAAAAVGKPAIREPGLYTMHVCLIANRDSYRANRAAIDALETGVREASAYISGNPAQAREAVEKITGLEPNALAKAWDPRMFAYVSDEPSVETIMTGERDALKDARMQIDGYVPKSLKQFTVR